MPSPTSSTVPTSSMERSTSKLSISRFRTEVISSGRIVLMLPSWPLLRSREELLAQRGEPRAHRAVDQAVADADGRAAENRRVDALVDHHALARGALEAALDRRAQFVGE